MLFNILVFVFIVLITLYLSTQGMLSALLALVTATFASILAMALLPALQGILAGWRPDYARGGTFLLVFLIAYAVCRIVADMVVIKNIKLPPLINRSAGGLIGFCAALVVVGTTVIGIEMLPLPRELLGFDRFPGETTMKGDTPGEAATHASGVWFSPDRVVLALWNGASGRGLGGQRAWGDVHPDLSVESYGYRNTAGEGSARAIPSDLFSVKDAWATTDPKEIQAAGITGVDSGKRVVMVRTEVKKGTDAPHMSADPNEPPDPAGPYFRIAATQVRLVTDKGHQYYPMGYLEQGRDFVPLSLDNGRLVDDYVNDTVVEDWVFQISDDEKPTLIEMKELAQADLGDKVRDKPTRAAAGYPRKPYLAKLASIGIQIDLKGKTLKDGKAYLVLPTVLRKDIQSDLDFAYGRVQEILGNIDDHKNGWGNGGPGVMNRDFFASAAHAGLEAKNAQDETALSWVQTMPLFLAGQARPEGDQNLATYSDFVEKTMVPIWSGVHSGNALTKSVSVDATGKAEFAKLNPGSFTVIISARTENGFFLWIRDQKLDASAHPTLSGLAADSTANFSVELPAQ